MNKFLTLIFVLTMSLSATAQLQNNKYHKPITLDRKWKGYNPGEVTFIDNSPESDGSKIYHRIITDRIGYIQENALRVLQTLYSDPSDKNIPKLKHIRYTIEDYDGISEKGGGGDHVYIRYSTRWIERSFANNDTMKLDYETRGVLYHELCHAYQLEPKNCGSYGDGGEFWCFIEGMADATRLACGCFEQDFNSKDRPKADTWRKGYRVAGYFIYWLQLNKDKDFIRKFNRSAAELETWSWDAALKHILGDKPENGVEALWDEYQKAIGDR